MSTKDNPVTATTPADTSQESASSQRQNVGDTSTSKSPSAEVGSDSEDDSASDSEAENRGLGKKGWAKKGDGGRERFLLQHVERYAAESLKGKDAANDYLTQVMNGFCYTFPYDLPQDKDPDVYRVWTPTTPPDDDSVLTKKQRKRKAKYALDMTPRVGRWLELRATAATRPVTGSKTSKKLDPHDPLNLLLFEVADTLPVRGTRQGFQQFWHEEPETVAEEVARGWKNSAEFAQAVAKQKEKAASGKKKPKKQASEAPKPTGKYRTATARRLFGDLAPSKQQEYKDRAAQEKAQEAAAFDAAMKSWPPKDPMSKQAAMNSATPVLDRFMSGLGDLTGLHFILVGVGPIPLYHGTIHTRYWSSGLNLAPSPVGFPDWDPAAFNRDVLDKMKAYGRTAFTAEECMAAALPEEMCSGSREDAWGGLRGGNGSQQPALNETGLIRMDAPTLDESVPDKSASASKQKAASKQPAKSKAASKQAASDESVPAKSASASKRPAKSRAASKQTARSGSARGNKSAKGKETAARRPQTEDDDSESGESDDELDDIVAAVRNKRRRMGSSRATSEDDEDESEVEVAAKRQRKKKKKQPSASEDSSSDDDTDSDEQRPIRKPLPFAPVPRLWTQDGYVEVPRKPRPKARPTGRIAKNIDAASSSAASSGAKSSGAKSSSSTSDMEVIGENGGQMPPASSGSSDVEMQDGQRLDIDPATVESQTDDASAQNRPPAQQNKPSASASSASVISSPTAQLGGASERAGAVVPAIPELGAENAILQDPIACPADVSAWLAEVWPELAGVPMPPAYWELIRAFLAFEEAHGWIYGEKKFSSVGRPKQIAAWIRADRVTKTEVRLHARFEMEWWVWWKLAQPGWRHAKEDWPDMSATQTWDGKQAWGGYVVIPGKNGIMSPLLIKTASDAQQVTGTDIELRLPKPVSCRSPTPIPHSPGNGNVVGGMFCLAYRGGSTPLPRVVPLDLRLECRSERLICKSPKYRDDSDAAGVFSSAGPISALLSRSRVPERPRQRLYRADVWTPIDPAPDIPSPLSSTLSLCVGPIVLAGRKYGTGNASYSTVSMYVHKRYVTCPRPSAAVSVTNCSFGIEIIARAILFARSPGLLPTRSHFPSRWPRMRGRERVILVICRSTFRKALRHVHTESMSGERLAARAISPAALPGALSLRGVPSARSDQFMTDYLVDAVAGTVDFALGRSGSGVQPASQNPSMRRFVAFTTRVLTRAAVTSAIVLVSLVYIVRARPHLSIAVEEWAYERVLLGALIVASKYTNDSTLKNLHWSMSTGVFGIRDIGRVEQEFLEVLAWELSIHESDILQHSRALMLDRGFNESLAL
ncbi:Cyclin N-terminal domain-containing protein [Mycena kentingensis (nom. inval.)]|nr:Cyclin N-terminal domain-containing protein [Mycena kentingensis (nom. inval.)]